MTSQELLKETQKAAGNENLTRWHEILISSGKDLREIQMVSHPPLSLLYALNFRTDRFLQSLDSDKATLKTAEDRNAALERDVERFRERLKLEQEVRLVF